MGPSARYKEAIDNLFPLPTEETAAKIAEEPVYAEALLHQTPNANKYYVSFQRYTRQFIDDKEEACAILQPSSSKITTTSKQIVQGWDELEHLRLEGDKASTILESAAANSLFSWASGDAYIAARKLELQRKNASNGGDNPHKSAEMSTSSSVASLRLPTLAPQKKVSFTQRLHKTIESESAKFIQDRIDLIKLHHQRQASQRVDDRKREDHEMHIRRVKLKEEKYANALKAAIAQQNTKRNSGFFGSLFGSKMLSNSFVLEIPDNPYPSAPHTPTLRASTIGVSGDGDLRLEFLQASPKSRRSFLPGISRVTSPGSFTSSNIHQSPSINNLVSSHLRINTPLITSMKAGAGVQDDSYSGTSSSHEPQLL